MTERDDSSQGFLGRWSRKKIEAEREPDASTVSRAPEVPRTEEIGLPAEAEAKSPAAQKPEFDLASLPSLDSITAATDIRGFLTPGVPKELARAALRRAWAADPAIRDFKGLAENDWDFTDPAAMPGFGALPPGYDIKKLVAQIFSGDEKPAEPDAAAKKLTEQQALPIARDTEPAAAAAEVAPPGNGEQAVSVPTNFVQRDNNIALHNSSSADETEEPKTRRLHGGALPQ